MRKLISVILAVIMVASVAAVSFSAVGTDTAAVGAGTATVTMVGIKGETVTQTYAVGETFTATICLNANTALMALDSTGRYGVSSLKAQQTYDSDILEIADAFNEKDGTPVDAAAMMPILDTNGNAVANLGNPGVVHYNASKAAVSGYKFINDTCALLVTQYTVKDAGTVTIENTATTIALSDTALTRIVDKGEIVNDGFGTPVALSEPAPSGFTVSGTITSYLSGTEAITATLSDANNTFTLTPEQTIVEDDGEGYVETEAAISFANVPAGTYTLSIEKKNHVTRDYEVVVSDQMEPLEAKICPLGDINNDGDVTMKDYAKAYKHAQEIDTVTGYNLLCGDVVGNDGEILMKDYAKIYKHVQEISSLWT